MIRDESSLFKQKMGQNKQKLFTLVLKLKDRLTILNLKCDLIK